MNTPLSKQSFWATPAGFTGKLIIALLCGVLVITAAFFIPFGFLAKESADRRDSYLQGDCVVLNRTIQNQNGGYYYTSYSDRTSRSECTQYPDCSDSGSREGFCCDVHKRYIPERKDPYRPAHWDYTYTVRQILYGYEHFYSVVCRVNESFHMATVSLTGLCEPFDSSCDSRWNSSALRACSIENKVRFADDCSKPPLLSTAAIVVLVFGCIAGATWLGCFVFAACKIKQDYSDWKTRRPEEQHYGSTV